MQLWWSGSVVPEHVDVLEVAVDESCTIPEQEISKSREALRSITTVKTAQTAVLSGEVCER